MSKENPQKIFDVAVIVPTVLRPTLAKTIRSIFEQNFKGRIQILIGIDKKLGDMSILDDIQKECPERIHITVIDLGYSTSVRHGGTYSNKYSGALRSILSYAANSRYISYVDDDDWWHPEHLSSLLSAIVGKKWAFSYRWFVDKETGKPICEDTWDSVGPGKGINAERFGGFVSPSNLLLDKEACHHILPLWSFAAFKDGTGEDRLVFNALLKIPEYATNNMHTCYYQIPKDVQKHAHHAKEFKARGIFWIYEESSENQISAKT